MEQLIQLVRVHSHDRSAPVDQALAHHVHRHLHGGLGRPLPGAGLEQVQRPALHRELDVLHVPVVLLQGGAYLLELGVQLGPPLGHFGDRLGIADSGHHVLSLSVGEELAEGLLLARGRVAGEGDSGAGVLAHVAEHHRLYVHRRPHVVGDAMHAAVVDGAAAVPAAEYGLDCAPQLLPGVIGEGMPRFALDYLLEGGDQGFEVVGRELGIALDAALALERL